MPGGGIVPRILAPSPRLQDVGLLIVRVGFGLMLVLGHGIRKLPPSARFIEGVGSMGFPMPALFAWGATFSEVVGGTLLVLGLFTRPASVFVATTMAVAFFIRHAADPFRERELALAYLLVALALLVGGAGRFSLDRWIAGRLQSLRNGGGR